MAAKKKKPAAKNAAKKSAKKPVKKVAQKPTAKKIVAKTKVKAAPAKATPAKTKSVSTPTAARKPSPAVLNAITPLDDRLIVAPEEAPTRTAGGLYIPQSNDRPSRGQVLAKGRGRRNKKGQLRPLDVNVGDQVMFADWSGTKITVEGNDLLILREEDILGIVT